MRRFLAELRARGVLRVATAYLVVSWVALEIGHTLFNVFELPHAGLQLIFVLLAIGFPVVLLGTWQGWFGVTQGGPSADVEHTHAGTTHAAKPHEGPWLAGIFAAVAVFAVAIAIAVRFFGMGHTGTGHEIQPTPARVSALDGKINQAPARFTPPLHSVAVLSFVNMSGDPKDDYFSDGLAEELLNTLVRIQGLRVAARTSSFAFKGTAVDIPTVGRRLNVGTVLEGSVRKAGERVRITSQLINAVDGYHVWSHTYDRELKDIFALQTEIATAVATAMKVALLGDAHLNDGGTTNIQAFDAYLRGRQALRATDEASVRSAIASLEEAIALDPGYALAHGERGEALAALANDWEGNPQRRAAMFDQARASVDKAVALAPKSGQVYGSFGAVLILTTNDYSAIESALRRSIALEPGNADLLVDYADFAGRQGRADALDAANRAVTLNPLDALPRQVQGIVLLYARRYDEARVALHEALQLDDSTRRRSWAGWNELAAGRTQAAIPFCEADRASFGAQTCLAIAYHRLGRKTDSLAEIARMKAAQGDLLAYQYAEIYAQFGEPDVALKWLARALELKDAGLADIKVDPFLDPLRGLPEFQALLRRLNLAS